MIHLGDIYGNLRNDSTALVYLDLGLAIAKDLQNKVSEAHALTEIAKVYYVKTDYRGAIEKASQALSIARKIGSLGRIEASSSILHKSYRALNKFEQALEMHELYISTLDSLKSEANQNEVIRQEYKYKYDKKHLSDSLGYIQQQNIEQLAHKAELIKEANQRYVLYGSVGFLLILGGIVFRSYQLKKKDNILISEQKQKVELQKEIVEEKNKEILDSITYAKRIQSAILPPNRIIKEHLPNSFVLYKPKDIVAGDFYWLEHIGGKVLFAAADCTGHGVPGAMVSVICNGALNRSVREFNLTDPGQILDKAREIVVEEFEKSEEEVKDGMDIALCSLEGNKLQYAGAHNPLWLIREGEIIETKANKQPIGKFDNIEPYTTHTFNLQKGDCIYIFSDGFVDQFGGEKGKKFKSKAFREMLISVQDKSMEEQKIIIDEVFENWRGDLEQLDDVCVIGVQV